MHEHKYMNRRISTPLRITLITQRSRVLFRLPEIFDAADVHVTLIARPDCELAKSPFIHRFIPLIGGQPDQKRSFVADLLDTGCLEIPEDLGDWVIVAEDQEIRLLSESGLPKATLDCLLPAKNILGRSLFDSKVGLANALTQLSIPQPPMSIAVNYEELKEILSKSDTALLVKADVGHGGRTITDVPIPKDFNPHTIPNDWFPVVVQEHVDGEPISVEAQFVNGQLVGYLYSSMIKFLAPFSNSTERWFKPPPDRQVEKSLAELGRAGALHALANCTFIKHSRTGEHLLVEVDLRPNSWHQFGPKLGVDWISLYKNPPQQPVHNEGFQRVALYPLSLVRATKYFDFASVWAWIAHSSGTREIRNRKDPVINREEFRLIYRHPLGRILKSTWRVIPVPIQRFMNKNGIRTAGRRLVTSAPEN
jgi:hypothetical protein